MGKIDEAPADILDLDAPFSELVKNVRQADKLFRIGFMPVGAEGRTGLDRGSRQVESLPIQSFFEGFQILYLGANLDQYLERFEQ